MPNDFEEQLRRSLAARATDVSPDPAMFARVQARIRRGRAFRFALAGVAGSIALAGMAFAAPALMDRRVEFEPGPVAQQPASETAPAPDETAVASEAPPQSLGLPVVPLVYTDGAAVFSVEAGQEPAELIASGCPAEADCDIELVRSVAARPGMSGAGITAVAARSCAGLEDTGGGESFQGDTCPSSVMFSPDGRHLAWIGTTGSAGSWALYTVDWDDEGAGNRHASFELPIADPTQVSLEAWEWTEQTTTTADGYITMRARREGVVQLLRWPIQRQGDGALAVTLETQGVPTLANHAPLAFAAAGDGVTYTMEAVLGPDGLDDAKIVRRTGTEVEGELGLPPELFDNISPSFDEFDLWLSAAGDTVVYGNSATRMAWSVDWAAAPREPSLIEIGGEFRSIVRADLYRPLPSPPPDPTPAPQGLVEVQVHFTQEGSECGEEVVAYPRMVRGPGVLRGALEELLEGPERQEVAAGAASSFSEETSGALNDVTIGDNGVAVVDFTTDFTDAVISASCASSAAFAPLDATVRQFPSVAEVVYSLEGSIQRFYAAYEAVPPPHRPDIPLPVTRTQQAISDALVTARQDNDYGALARLIERDTFSCSLSDQNEDCIALWQQQEAEGGDPLGALAEILQGEAAQVDGAQMWVLPARWAAPNPDYSGPRIGIDADGTWRYYQQEGG